MTEEDAVCLGGTRSNMQHTYLLSEVQGKIWMPLIVNVKLKSADSDQVSRSQRACHHIEFILRETVKLNNLTTFGFAFKVFPGDTI